MKRYYRICALLLAALFALCALTACGGADSAKAEAADRDYAEAPQYSLTTNGEAMKDIAVETEMVATAGTTGSLQLGAVDPSQKMIYTANYQIQTLCFDDSVAALNALTAELGGYVENSRVSGSASGNYYETRHASYTLRIPAANLQLFLDRVGSVGTVVSESLTGRDVTLEYVDTESRLNALRAQEARIIELLADATDLQYVLEIERELSDIRYQIESYTSQLKQLDSRISYSTVEISLQEVYTVVEPKPEPQSFGDKLAETFRSSVTRIWEGMQAFAIWFLGNIVELALWVVGLGACVWLVVWGIKRIVRKHRAKEPSDQ